jgi:hypothetical protein
VHLNDLAGELLQTGGGDPPCVRVAIVRRKASEISLN